MALYAIGDTHLSLGADKSMEVFGGSWEGYVEKLEEGFSCVSDDDTVVLCGDLNVAHEEIDLKKLNLTSDTRKVQDMKGRYLLLFANQWSINWALEHNEGLQLSEFSRN